MNLKEFRELTKDLPEDSEIWVLDEGDARAWKMPGGIEVHEERHVYNASPLPESMKKKRTEIRIRLPK